MATIPNPAIRGRDAELAALGEQLDRVRSGIGAVVALEGSAGMGKSRLLAEAARIGRRLSFTVGSGVARPGDSVVELAVLMSALFDGAEPVLSREALRDSRAGPEQRYWLLQDLQALLERAALDAPLMVCLDDLQWADSGTVAALRALPRRLAALPIAWVIAFRPDHGSAQLRSAIEQLECGGAEKFVLGPLERQAVTQLTADLMQAEPDQALLELAEGAKGSPFLLVELLLGLREEGLVRVESGRAELMGARLPDRVRATMRERLERMSESAHQLATVATSLDRRFAVSDLATMLDVPPSALLKPVRELIDAGMLIEEEERLAFRHDLIREAVRGCLPVSARRALDRQAADVLLAGGALPVEVAMQLYASADPGDEIAITTLLKAADALASTDPGAGADLSKRALELAPRGHPLRGPLVAQSAVLLHASGRTDEAKVFADTALREVLPPEQEAEVRLSIAGMFALSPDVRADAGRQALALADLSPGVRARHLARLVYNLVQAGRPQDARALVVEARSAVGSSGDGAAIVTLTQAEGALEYVDGHFGRALQIHETALRIGFPVGEDTRERVAHQWRCELLAVVDRLDEALQEVVNGIAASQHDRQQWALSFFETWQGRQLLQAGRLPNAAAMLDGRYSAEDAHDVVAPIDAAGVVALGRVALHTGHERQKRQTAEIAQVMLDGTPSVRRHAAWLLALHAMADGDPAAARGWLCTFGEEERKAILPLYPMDVTDETHLVRIAIATEDVELAESAVAAARRRAELNPGVRSLAATAAHTRGLLMGSATELARAVELFADGPRPLALASALEDLGTIAGGLGVTERSIEALDQALVAYAQAGATWDAGRVRGRLRALGVRRRLVAAERPDSGWAAMTASELDVARLVAQGLTNREVAEQLFVSPHTVSSHLRHVFAKLDVNSRVELTRLAVQHEPRS
jgi:DNA-binding CsgD family transcriptional regulator/DNA-binding IscR family transcriptional regulator